MRIEILDKAEDDLVEGFQFYESQHLGLGAYFLDSLYSDIDSLSLSMHGGMHRVVYRGYHRMLSKRFPFAIYYTVTGDTAFIHAVVDCRRSPAWIRHHLR